MINFFFDHFKIKKLNFVSSMVAISLASLGMFKRTKIRIAYSITFAILCSGGLLGAVVGFFNTTGKGYKFEAWTSVIANLNSVLLFVTMNLSRDRILPLFAKLKGSKEEKDDFIERTNKHIKKKLIWYFITLTALSSLLILISLILPLFEEKIDNMFSLVVPFWLSCGNTGADSMVPCVHWETFSRKELFVGNIIQAVILTLQFVVYISSFALYVINITELMMHLENIDIKVKCFNMQNNGESVIENRRSDFNLILNQRTKRSTKDLLEIIKYQQFLHSCILQTIHAWKPYLTCIYATCFVDSTMFLFTAFIEQKKSPTMVMKTVILVTFQFLGLLLTSSYAQTLATLKYKMLEAITNVRWYKQCIKFRKIYIPLLILNQKGLQMMTSGMIRINLNSFLQFMKTVYSILNMLILKYGKLL